MFLKNHRQSGFTLNEMMLVLAIIAILATIAIPNYLHLQNRAKQSEAKSNLASLATTESVFFKYYGTVTSRFDVLGFNPQGQLSYLYGFTNDQAPPATSFQGNASCISTSAVAGQCFFTPQWSSLNSATSAGTISSAAALPNGGTSFSGVGGQFNAYAVGNLIGSSSNANPDVWKIDSGDNLMNIEVGI